jgi:hypothetical protein
MSAAIGLTNSVVSSAYKLVLIFTVSAFQLTFLVEKQKYETNNRNKLIFETL